MSISEAILKEKADAAFIAILDDWQEEAATAINSTKMELVSHTPLAFKTATWINLGLRARVKIKSHFIHPGFRSSSPDPGVAKSSKELAIPPVLPPPDRTNLTQTRAPKM